MGGFHTDSTVLLVGSHVKGTLTMPKRKKFKANVYIDGFNLYFGLKAAKLLHCRWLNVVKLARGLLLPNNQLGEAKYFTARISAPEGVASEEDKAKLKRQATYLDALDTLPQLRRLEGQFQPDPVTCYSCGRTWMDHEEKMTDVRIATEMLVDAYSSACDTIIVVSGDSDLVPPIRAIQHHLGKRVVVAFPPARGSDELRQVAHTAFTVSQQLLEQSQLPQTVVTGSGYELKCPNRWASPSAPDLVG